MDTTTTYLGLTLRTPLVVGAGPLCESVDACRAAEKAGAGAVVMRSLFEEQITRAVQSTHAHLTAYEDAHAEANSYFPEPLLGADPMHGPERYLAQLSRLKSALTIPVIASLNGVTPGGWLHYAQRMQEAGADAIELNIYHLATDVTESPRDVEKRYADVLSGVLNEVTIPVAVKLSPFFSAPVYTCASLDAAGAAGCVLFNRFYQPDIDIDNLDVRPVIHLSESSELLLRLRWLAATFGHVQGSLIASGGVHTGRDAIKALMAGACAVQMTSALLQHGPAHIRKVLREMVEWMTENEYESVTQMVGSMSLARTPDPRAFERTNYMEVLSSWEPPRAV